MGRFIATTFTDLIPLTLPDYPIVEAVPAHGKFLLLREPTPNEHAMLTSIYQDDFVVVSDRYATETWGREEILSRVKALRQSKKRPKITEISDETFRERIRTYYVTDTWKVPRREETLYDLFVCIDSVKRYGVLFKLLNEFPPEYITASVLTFISTCMNPEMGKNKTYAYRRILKAKERRVRSNCLPAIQAYLDCDADQRMRCLVLIDRIGGKIE